MKLSEMAIGKCAVITAVKLQEFYLNRLIKMGVSVGSKVKTMAKSPFGQTVEIKVKGVRLALGKNIAEGITVKYD